MSLPAILDSATRAHVPVLIWGPPGVGKSAAIQQWAASRQLRCWTVIASLREPADFGGLPILDSSQPVRLGTRSVPTVAFAPPRFAVEAAASGGVIFLDELTTAPPAVQAALLRAVIDKAFGDLELDRTKVTIIAAANPPAEAAGGWDLAAPLANRFSHHTYPLVPEAWVRDFPSYWGAPPSLSFAGTTLSEAAWARTRALVSAFIRVRPGLLLHMPSDVSRLGQAWPSPRTWDFASRLITAVVAGGANWTEALPLAAGCVGEGPATELIAWIHDLDLPDPAALLTSPCSYQHPDRGDKAYAVLTAVVQTALTDLTPERWAAAWTILSRAAAAGGADVAAGAARSLALGRRRDLALPVSEITAFLPILQAAGLLTLPSLPGPPGPPGSSTTS